MVVTAGGAVVLGGLVAAVTEPLALDHGSWIAAYLVLVVGVAQGAMGRARTSDAVRSQIGAGLAQFGCWNVGGALVIVGTVVERPWVVDLGSVLVCVALALALLATRGLTGPARAAWPRRAWPVAYRALLVVLLVSVPIGMVLSHLRHP